MEDKKQIINNLISVMNKFDIHVFSDISRCNQERYTGIFLIKRCAVYIKCFKDLELALKNKQVQFRVVQLPSINSNTAEIICSLAGLYYVRRELKCSSCVLHTDLAHISFLLKKGGNNPSSCYYILDNLIKKYNISINTNVRSFIEYKWCHLRARIFAGCYGLFHPEVVKYKNPIEVFNLENVKNFLKE